MEGSLDNLANAGCGEEEGTITDPSSPVMLDGPLSPVSLLAAKGREAFVGLLGPCLPCHGRPIAAVLALLFETEFDSHSLILLYAILQIDNILSSIIHV